MAEKIKFPISGKDFFSEYSADSEFKLVNKGCVSILKMSLLLRLISKAFSGCRESRSALKVTG